MTTLTEFDDSKTKSTSKYVPSSNTSIDKISIDKIKVDSDIVNSEDIRVDDNECISYKCLNHLNLEKSNFYKKPIQLAEELAIKTIETINFFSLDKHKKDINRKGLKDLLSSNKNYELITQLINDLNVSHMI